MGNGSATDNRRQCAMCVQFVNYEHSTFAVLVPKERWAVASQRRPGRASPIFNPGGPEGALGGRFLEATGPGSPIVNPVVPSGAALCTRQALFKRSGAVPICFAEAEGGGSSVGDEDRDAIRVV